MGVGYLFGCLMSILLWKIDKHQIFLTMNVFLKNKIKNIYIMQVLYILILIILILIIDVYSDSETIKAIIGFVIIEISSSERKNLCKKGVEKKYFYDTLSIIAKALICGFIAPIIYILIFGNIGGIIYTTIYYVSDDSSYITFGTILSILNIVPCIITDLLLYLIYIPRNKTFIIDFKGDFFYNMIFDPLLNIYILSAYIESVNFYYHVGKKNVYYLKSYGVYNSKIDNICVKDFLSIIYAICFIIYMCFWLYIETYGSIVGL